jgi:hypothetical protein
MGGSPKECQLESAIDLRDVKRLNLLASQINEQEQSIAEWCSSRG